MGCNSWTPGNLRNSHFFNFQNSIKQGASSFKLQTMCQNVYLEEEEEKKKQITLGAFEEIRASPVACVRRLSPRRQRGRNVKRTSGFQSGRRRGPTSQRGFTMAKLNGGSSGCRAVILAGKYLSSPSPLALTRSSGQRQRRMFGPRRCMMSSDVSGDAGKKPQQQQPDSVLCLSASDRRVPTNRSLIYRDVRAFLDEVGGDPREARYWLTQFQSATAAQSPAFAVLEVGHELRTSLHQISSFLSARHLNHV